MKSLFLLLQVLTALHVQANTNPVVVFTKTGPDGRALEVVRKTIPFTVPEEADKAWTNFQDQVIRTTNIHGAITATTNHLAFVINKTQMKPLPKWLDRYSIIMRDGNHEAMVPNGAMAKLRNAIWDNLEFIDIQFTNSSATFLYRSGPDPLGKWLFVTLTGVAARSAVNTNLAFPFNGRAQPLFGIGSTNLPEATTELNQSIIEEHLLWAPSQSKYSKLKSARLLESQAEGRVTVEVTAVLDNYIRTQTNTFVNARWSVSEGPPVAARP